MRLILNNYHDIAALTASSAAPECEIDNTQRNEREYVWRGTGLEEVIEADLPSVQYIDGVVVLGHNFSSAGRVRLELIDSLGEVVHDSGELVTAEYIPAGVWRAGVDPWGATYNDQINSPLTFINTPLTPCSRYRLTVIDPRNRDGAVQIWRIVAGAWFTMDYGPSWGLDLRRVTKDQRKRTAGGSARIVGPGYSWRELSVAFEHLTPRDHTQLTIQLGQRGIGADVFVDSYPTREGVERISAAFLAGLDNPYGATNDRYRNYKESMKFVEV